MMKLTQSRLHQQILLHLIETGSAPSISRLTDIFAVSNEKMIASLQSLQQDHGVVLHPVSNEIWVVHPFSNAPTNFWLQADKQGWWANCAWCSLGAASLIKRDVDIHTKLGGEAESISIKIRDGQLIAQSLLVHFPIAMTRIWDNVIFSCSCMLVFDSEQQIDQWCKRHGMPKGDVQPLDHIWEFAKVWYQNHLDEHWVKWTINESSEIFSRFGLSHEVWQLPQSEGRF